MSSTTIHNGGVATKDPSDSRIFVFDWDAENLDPGVTITGNVFTLTEVLPVAAWSSTTAYVKGDQVLSAGIIYACILLNTNQVPPNATYWVSLGTFTDLTKDNEGIMTASGSRKTTLRLIGGTAGHTWDVTNRITTNEIPAQIKERSFRLLVEQL